MPWLTWGESLVLEVRPESPEDSVALCVRPCAVLCFVEGGTMQPREVKIHADPGAYEFDHERRVAVRFCDWPAMEGCRR